MINILPVKKFPGKTRRRKIQEFNLMEVRLKAWMIRSKIPFRSGQLHRTKEQAEWNVKKGVGILNSKHRFSLAIDIWISPKGWDIIGWPRSKRNVPNQWQSMYRRMGEYWEKMGGVWGGAFSSRWDPYHYEHPEHK